MKNSVAWSVQELDILCKYYPVMRVRELAKLLPRRSIHSIYKKARNIELRAYNYSAIDSMIEEDILTPKQMAVEIGCSYHTVLYRLRKNKNGN